MNIKRNRAVIMIAVILVLTASFSLGYIYDSAPGPASGVGGKKDKHDVPDEWRYDIPEGESFDWLFNIVLGLIIGLLIGSIMGIMMVSRNDLLAFLFSFLSMAFLFLISFYIELHPEKSASSFGFYLAGWFKSNMFTMELSSALKVGLILLSLLAIAISFIYKIDLGGKKRKDLSVSKEGAEEVLKEDIADEFSDTVDAVVKRLREGRGEKKVIIRCYLRMCRIFERRGIMSDESMTPREFQEEAIHRLKVSRKIIDQLTRVFEEARYSDHILDSRDERDARIALKKLKNELKVID